MKVWHFDERQQALLRNLVQDFGAQLLSVTFNDPKDDEATIRQHAYIKGKMDLAAEMLKDDYPTPEQINDANVHQQPEQSQ